MEGRALIVESVVFFIVIAASLALQKRQRRKQNESIDDSTSPEVRRFRQLLASGRLVHPFIRAEYFQHDAHMESIRQDHCVANFTDLANALATCCGATIDSQENPLRDQLVQDIKSNHILVILCDGMGTSILETHLASKAFLRRHNQCHRLRAVFPSTTPAALTTLATGQWPGQHGVPGWDLREQQNCDYPGEAGGPIVQLRILAPCIMNQRSYQPANYASLDDVFLVPPWSRSLHETAQEQSKEAATSGVDTIRRMMYINAYIGEELSSEGIADRNSCFSSWQTGQASAEDQKDESRSPIALDLAAIGETCFSTLGKPEGSRAALEYFQDGVDKALHAIARAEASGQSTFTYLYTAHPDKHMHALGTDHPEVRTVVRGINGEIERLWSLLGNRTELFSKYGIADGGTSSAASNRIDASVVVTADHGHITVHPKDMVVLPNDIIECLEYANVGVLGKGRHAYLHCRAGLQSTLRERWQAAEKLHPSFLLLTIEEAIGHRLFGPAAPLPKVRPRMGDFVAVAISQRTLVSPKEWTHHQYHCQGTHGSLLEEEMKIPFVLCSPSQTWD